jgi:L-serine/L-threonine ammonia-lyase
MEENAIPDCIIGSIGGGGLMCGIIEGLIRTNLIKEDIQLVAVETLGADCFSQSVIQNKLVTLDRITRLLFSLKSAFTQYISFLTNEFSIEASPKLLAPKLAHLSYLNTI